jgi:hypothetical protein
MFKVISNKARQQKLELIPYFLSVQTSAQDHMDQEQ